MEQAVKRIKWTLSLVFLILHLLITLIIRLSATGQYRNQTSTSAMSYRDVEDLLTRAQILVEDHYNYLHPLADAILQGFSSHTCRRYGPTRSCTKHSDCLEHHHAMQALLDAATADFRATAAMVLNLRSMEAALRGRLGRNEVGGFFTLAANYLVLRKTFKDRIGLLILERDFLYGLGKNPRKMDEATYYREIQDISRYWRRILDTEVENFHSSYRATWRIGVYETGPDEYVVEQLA